MNKTMRKTINFLLNELRDVTAVEDDDMVDRALSVLNELNDVLDENEAALDNYSDSLKNSERVLNQLEAHDDMVGILGEMKDLVEDPEGDLGDLEDLIDQFEEAAAR